MVGRLLSGLLVLALSSTASWAATCEVVDEKALKWLDRMSRSLRETSYEGIFTYQHGNSLQSMHISHSVAGKVESEQVTRLSGSGSRIIRTEHPLDCIHPGHKLVRIGALYNEGSEECGVAEVYRLEVGGMMRVAGREAVVLNVLPRDMYRYGYQMALDTETGLLLRSQTLAQDGKILERFQFADLRIGEVRRPGTRVEVIHHASHQHHAEQSDHREERGSWEVSWVPQGFVLTEGDSLSGKDKTFTDGLAVFSVFLETMPELEAPGEGRARQGGTTAYTRGMAVDGQPVLVTVLGEVPINTARMVADSINWRVSFAD